MDLLDVNIPVQAHREDAALAMETGCEWFSLDRGFARFPDLRWRHPLEG